MCPEAENQAAFWSTKKQKRVVNYQIAVDLKGRFRHVKGPVPGAVPDVEIFRDSILRCGVGVS